MPKDVAYIFPGQGSQYVGMGKELYLASVAAREVFDKADKLLNNELKRICFSGPEELLKLTTNCQPAILTLSIACLKSLLVHPKSKNINVRFTAGLSLGEYSALVAAGALNFEEAITLVKQRAEIMEEEALTHPGEMAAIIGLEIELVKKICKDTGAEVANLNAPGQAVISGPTGNVDRAMEMAKDEGAKAVVALEVSGAFHSSLMQGAALRFSEVLKTANISAPKIPVIANVNALPETDSAQIRQNLTKQVDSSVLWEDSIRYIVSQGVNTFLEIGPGKVLKGLLRRIDPSLIVYNIEKPADINTLPF
ncbi:MAG: ACP S-malonyltransferase [Candidatus Omnitrophota bacterium]|nr:ACP S-malonyltransferase [Candidatus Omnitrophota bacterium]